MIANAANPQTDSRLKRRAPITDPFADTGSDFTAAGDDSATSTGGCKPPPYFSSTGYTDECHDTGLILSKIKKLEVPIYRIASLGHTNEDIAVHSSMEYDVWVTIKGRVYDVTKGSKNKLLPDRVKTLVTNAAGGNLDSYYDEFSSNGIIDCFEEQYFVGEIDRRTSPLCLAADYTLLTLTILMCAVMAAKFMASLQLSSRRYPEEFSRFCILQVPCYTESEESLKKTINSLSKLEYDDDKKLLFIIADGLIKGSGNDRMTPEIVLDILGVENAHEKLTSDTEVPRFDYIALGEGANRLNRAKVFSGFYRIETHCVPYIVVIKCGKESESRRPGLRFLYLNAQVRQSR
jgi:chitin synthase